MLGATPAAPSFGMQGSYNDYLSMPVGNMTSIYGRGILAHSSTRMILDSKHLIPGNV
jgi:hypothetical protein